MGILWPHSNEVQRDNNDFRVDAIAKLYVAGGTTVLKGYSDYALGTELSWPIETTNGRFPTVYIDFGNYRERVLTDGGLLLWDTDDIYNPEPPPAPDSVDITRQMPTGAMIHSFETGDKDGYVRLNGLTIGSALSAATERAHADTQDLYEQLWDEISHSFGLVPAGYGASAALDYAANKVMTLPDLRGAVLGGIDTMGNVAGNTMTGALVNIGSTTAVNSSLGGPTHTLTSAQLPVHTPAGTIAQITPAGTISQITPAGTISQITPAGTIAQITPAGSVNVTNGANLSQTGGSSSNLTGGGGARSDVTVTAAFVGTPFTPIFTGTPVTPTLTGTPVTPTFTGTPVTPIFTGASIGSGDAHNNMQRTVLSTVYIKL